MADKVIQLNPRIPFFLEGIHLVNPEKPYVILPESYVPSAKIEKAIKRGILIDVNKNILVDENAEAIKEKAEKEVEPKEVEKPVEQEVVEEKKEPKTKKKTASKK